MVGIGSNNPVITRSCSTSHLRPPVQGSLLKRLESTKAKAHVLDQTGTERHGPLRAHWWIKLMYDDLPDLPIKNGVVFQCATLNNQMLPHFSQPAAKNWIPGPGTISDPSTSRVCVLLLSQIASLRLPFIGRVTLERCRCSVGRGSQIQKWSKESWPSIRDSNQL